MAMKISDWVKANHLANEIERTIRAVSVFRQSAQIIVCSAQQGLSEMLTFAEIGDAVVTALEQRLARQRHALQKLGIAEIILSKPRIRER